MQIVYYLITKTICLQSLTHSVHQNQIDIEVYCAQMLCTQDSLFAWHMHVPYNISFIPYTG
jgi:hypothetical protein